MLERVGALWNIAERAGLHLVILTTGHGMVYPWEVLEPFDAHIDTYREQVGTASVGPRQELEIWAQVMKFGCEKGLRISFSALK